MIKTINNKKEEIKISFFKINTSDLPKDRRIFSISYSILKKSNNIDELMDYILKKEETTIPKEVGKIFHCNVADEKIKIIQEYEDRIDGAKAFLSPHTISNAILISKSFQKSKIFQKITSKQVEFEKKLLLGICINGIQMYLKGYIDIFSLEEKKIFELKTTNSVKSIENSIEKYEYNLQAYMYQLFTQKCFDDLYTVHFIFITKFVPPICIARIATEKIIKEGQKKFDQYIVQIFNLIVKHKLYYYFCLNKFPTL